MTRWFAPINHSPILDPPAGVSVDTALEFVTQPRCSNLSAVLLFRKSSQRTKKVVHGSRSLLKHKCDITRNQSEKTHSGIRRLEGLDLLCQNLTNGICRIVFLHRYQFSEYATLTAGFMIIRGGLCPSNRLCMSYENRKASL